MTITRVKTGGRDYAWDIAYDATDADGNPNSYRIQTNAAPSERLIAARDGVVDALSEIFGGPVNRNPLTLAIKWDADNRNERVCTPQVETFDGRELAAKLTLQPFGYYKVERKDEASGEKWVEYRASRCEQENAEALMELEDALCDFVRAGTRQLQLEFE